MRTYAASAAVRSLARSTRPRSLGIILRGQREGGREGGKDERRPQRADAPRETDWRTENEAGREGENERASERARTTSNGAREEGYLLCVREVGRKEEATI